MTQIIERISILIRNTTSILKKYGAETIIIIGVIVIIIMFSSTFIETYIIKRSFSDAFFYRAVGNCGSFIEYVAKDKQVWFDKCLSEKAPNGDRQIADYQILRIEYSRKIGKAFIQAKITRDGQKPYIVNYEMIKVGLRGLITNEQ
jgi:hypothetical protein